MLRMSEQVRLALKQHHISQGELEVMVDRSAITSMGEFNRRFHQWVFHTDEDGMVLDMKLLSEVKRSCN